ncbi:1224_t:CDS:2, partial [Acaulospora colombiana]
PPSSGSSQARGLIIGIVLASVVALALLGALGITCAIRYRRRTAYLSSTYNNNSGYRGNFSSSGNYQGGGSSGNRTNEKSGGSSLNPFAKNKRSKSFNSRALNAYKAGVIGALKPRGTTSNERDEQQSSSSFSKAYDTWNPLRGNIAAMDQIPPLPPSMAPPMLDSKQPNRQQQQERSGWKTLLPGFGRRGDEMTTRLRTMSSGEASRDDLPSAATTRIGDAATPTAIYPEKAVMDLKKGKGVFGAILPVYHARTRSTEDDIKVAGKGYDEKELPIAPEIIVTSPTTIPSSPSAYSSNGTTKSRSHRKSSSLFTPSTKNPNALRPSDASSRYSKSNTRSVRMSDPYVNYAAAYAAYAGFSDEIGKGKMEYEKDRIGTGTRREERTENARVIELNQHLGVPREKENVDGMEKPKTKIKDRRKERKRVSTCLCPNYVKGLNRLRRPSADIKRCPTPVLPLSFRYGMDIDMERSEAASGEKEGEDWRGAYRGVVRSVAPQISLSKRNNIS